MSSRSMLIFLASESWALCCPWHVSVAFLRYAHQAVPSDPGSVEPRESWRNMVTGSSAFATDLMKREETLKGRGTHCGRVALGASTASEDGGECRLGKGCVFRKSTSPASERSGRHFLESE